MKISIYDFKELKDKALSENATQEDINALGYWFENYGMDFWNGEEFSDEDFCLKPISKKKGIDDYIIERYELYK